MSAVAGVEAERALRGPVALVTETGRPVDDAVDLLQIAVIPFAAEPRYWMLGAAAWMMRRP